MLIRFVWPSPAVFAFALMILLAVSGSATGQTAADEKAKPASAPSIKADKDGWSPLFNGKNMDGWQVTNFGGEGEVSYKDGIVEISQVSIFPESPALAKTFRSPITKLNLKQLVWP